MYDKNALATPGGSPSGGGNTSILPIWSNADNHHVPTFLPKSDMTARFHVPIYVAFIPTTLVPFNTLSRLIHDGNDRDDDEQHIALHV
jgi:hypothetical protein